jgi:hypothetical protein
MDWLRSEDLKEEKNVTTPVVTIAGVALAGGMRDGDVRNGLFGHQSLPSAYATRFFTETPLLKQAMDLAASPSVLHPMMVPPPDCCVDG